MIVEDSQVVREFLRLIIARDPRLEVAEAVRSGEEALALLPQLKPDVISLDIRLPGMNGLEVTKRVMAEHPTPIVVVSSDVEDEELKISMNSLRAGALAVVQKPVGLSHGDYDRLAESLCTKLFIMSQVRVIRQRYSPLSGPTIVSSPLAAAKTHSTTPRVLGIVASTGGPSAVVRVLNDLPPDFPAPIILVQHITPGFVQGFVNWLDDVLPNLAVTQATHRVALRPGVVYVAPAESHTVYAGGGTLQLTNEPMLSGQKPSGTMLFRSMGKVLGADGVGVILTGMGEDGAIGLHEMFLAGAYTIAEHESTAVVNGMPGSAVRMGAASAVLPLPDIGPRLATIFRVQPSSAL